MQLTENAAAALETIREGQRIPDDQRTRLTADKAASGELAIRLEFVDQVTEEDQVAERAGTEIYLDPALAEPLADTLMDVQQSDEGLGFVFRPQES